MRLAVAALLALLATRAQADGLAERAARSYVIDTSGTTASIEVGGRGALVVVLRFEPGVHAQGQAPLRATLTASPGIELARERLGWPDVVEPRSAAPRLEVGYTAVAPGPQRVSVRLEFFACSSSWCVKQEREVGLEIAVAAGADGRATRPPTAAPSPTP